MALHPVRIAILALVCTCLCASAARAERQLYVANRGTNTLTIYDYENGSVVRQLADIAVCDGPQAIGVQPGTAAAAYLSCEDGEVWSINSLGLSATPLAIGDGFSRDLEVDASGTRLWIADFHPGEVTRLDTNHDELGFTAPHRPDGSTPGRPRHVALTNDGAWVYVASSDGVLWRINVASETAEYLVDFGTEIGDLVMSPSGNYAYLTGRQSFLLYEVQLSLCVPGLCNPNDRTLAYSPQKLVIDPAPGLGGPWVSFPSDNSVRPRSNLGYAFTIDGPAGLTYDDDFYSFLAASPSTGQICPFHFAAGPYGCIQQPLGTQPVAVAFGPTQDVVRASPGSWSFSYGELSATASMAVEIKNISKLTLKVTAAELVGEQKGNFTVSANECVGATLKPYKTCKISAYCKPARSGTIYKAGLHLDLGVSAKVKKLALVCAPLLAKK